MKSMYDMPTWRLNLLTIAVAVPLAVAAVCAVGWFFERAVEAADRARLEDARNR